MPGEKAIFAFFLYSNFQKVLLIPKISLQLDWYVSNHRFKTNFHALQNLYFPSTLINDNSVQPFAISRGGGVMVSIRWPVWNPLLKIDG